MLLKFSTQGLILQNYAIVKEIFNFSMIMDVIYICFESLLKKSFTVGLTLMCSNFIYKANKCQGSLTKKSPQVTDREHC